MMEKFSLLLVLILLTKTATGQEDRLTGNAIDIVVVRSNNSPTINYYSTPWSVRFPATNVWKGVLHHVFFGNKKKSQGAVKIICNGQLLESTMSLDRYFGDAAFTNEERPGVPARTPPMNDLRRCFENVDDPNQDIFNVRYEYFSEEGQLVGAEARLHLWDKDDSIVVSDIDGTLSDESSNVIRTVHWNEIHPHKGVCELYANIARTGIRTIYLTARPISWVTASRYFLEKALQTTSDGKAVQFPPGCLLTARQSAPKATMDALKVCQMLVMEKVKKRETR